MNLTASGIGISRLGQIAINTHDVERAVAFYQKALGLKLLFKAPPGLAFFDCGGVRLMLTRPEKPEFDHPSSVLYFAVADIQSAFGKMKESGVTFEDEPHLITRMPAHDLWMTFFRDSEGNLMGLMSEVPHASQSAGN
jgi:methylmalonyl-CoA/ethylmalonyl-CoA epimerase